MSPIPKLLGSTEINNPATKIGITTPSSFGSISNPISVLKKVYAPTGKERNMKPIMRNMSGNAA